MYFDINVALNGKHLFATNQRSATSIEKCEKIYKILKEKFLESEGYEISIVMIQEIGTPVKIAEIESNNFNWDDFIKNIK